MRQAILEVVGLLQLTSVWASKPVVDDPPQPTFFCRTSTTATVLDDFVYIDGGELTQLSTEEFGYSSHAVNKTLSISLKESWNSANAKINSMPKAQNVPRSSNAVLWADSATNSLYTWGGNRSPQTNSDSQEELWRLAADGNGGGVWSPVKGESHLIQTEGAAHVVAGAMGYALGGVAYSADSMLAETGLISYNMETGEWKNETAPIGQYGTMLNGKAEYVPFGDEGMVLFLGGAQSTVANASEMTEYSFNNLTFLDLKTSTWHSQQTTGPDPAPRQLLCTASALSTGNTFEIFVYGGYSETEGATFDDVFVLSLPGFVWFRADTNGTRRAGHGCTRVGKGQMLSIGGADDSSTDPDPWPRGIGVMDMSSMTWQDEYDADDEDYESPPVVRQWYKEGRLGDVEWSTGDVKSLFQQLGETAVEEVLPSLASSSSESSEKSDNIPLEAIVGVAVGGAAVLGLGCMLLYLCRKRRKAKRGHGRNMTASPGFGWHSKNFYATGSKAPEYRVFIRGNATPVPFELARHSRFLSDLCAPVGTGSGERGQSRSQTERD